MDEPIIDIEAIARNAHQAAETKGWIECPYPDDWQAADHWRQAYHARALQMRGELTA